VAKLSPFIPAHIARKIRGMTYGAKRQTCSIEGVKEAYSIGSPSGQRNGLIAYVGWTFKKSFVELIQSSGMGRVWVSGVPRLKNVIPERGDKFFFDNGAFLDWRNGSKLDLQRFFRDMDRLPKHCDWGVLPDVVGGGDASLALSLRAIPDCRTDWDWYLAIQDNMTMERVAVAVVEHNIKGLFLGGTDKFKSEALSWASLAHTLGIKFHYGRAGTLRKVRYAKFVKSDSLDSSFPLWSVKRMEDFTAWITKEDGQTSLFAERAGERAISQLTQNPTLDT